MIDDGRRRTSAARRIRLAPIVAVVSAVAVVGTATAVLAVSGAQLRDLTTTAGPAGSADAPVQAASTVQIGLLVIIGVAGTAGLATAAVVITASRRLAAAVRDLDAATRAQADDARQRDRITTAVTDVRRHLSLDPEPPELIEHLASSLIGPFAAAAVQLCLFSDAVDGHVVRHRHPRGGPSEAALDPRLVELVERSWRGGLPVEIGPGPLRAQTGHEPARIELTDSEFAAVRVETRGAAGDAVVLVAVGAGRRCLGYLALTRGAAAGRWSDAEIEAVATVAHDTGRAVVAADVFRTESQLLQELHDQQAARNDFVARLSREVRTPLAAILGHLESIGRGDAGPIRPALRASLSAIDHHARRLRGQVDDLVLARTEPRPQTTSPQQHDLGRLAREVLDRHRSQSPAVGRRLLLGPVEVGPVLGDDTDLDRLIDSLVDNALVHGGAAATVTTSVRTDDDQVVLTVSDDGVGVPAADLPHLFERFFRRTDPERASAPGSGLGLTVAKLIVDKHAGTIAVCSEPGLGTTVTVRLPRIAIGSAQPYAARRLQVTGA